MSNRLSNRFDNAGCQTRLTTGWMFVYTIQPVVKPVVQPVWHPVLSCKRGLIQATVNALLCNPLMYKRFVFYFAPVGVRTIVITASDECLFDRRLTHPLAQTSRNFLHVLSGAVARSSSDDSWIRCVLPVLWMTSCFPGMGPYTAYGIGSVYPSERRGACSKKSNFQRHGCHTVWLCRRIQWQQVAHRGRSLMYTIALFTCITSVRFQHYFYFANVFFCFKKVVKVARRCCKFEREALSKKNQHTSLSIFAEDHHLVRKFVSPDPLRVFVPGP